MARKRDIRYRIRYQIGDKSWIETIPVDKLEVVASILSRLTDEDEGELEVGHTIEIKRIR